MAMDPREDTAGRGYNPTLPSGRKKRKKPAKPAPKKPAPKKPAPKPAAKNSTGGDQPVRVGRAAKQQSGKKLQYIISEKRGMYVPKTKKKDTRSAAQRIVEASKKK